MKKVSKTENIMHSFFIFGAILCFLPQMLGYHIKINSYPAIVDNFYSFVFENSFVVSAVVTLPLLIERALVVAAERFFNNNKEVTNIPETEYFRFSIDFLLLLIVTNIVALTYILPTYQLDTLPGLLIARDVLFTWNFLFNLHRLGWRAIAL